MNTRSKKNRLGQSIVEAIVAISILTTGFLGIMTLLTKSFQLNRAAADQTKATYLAAEGIEVAKSLIDHSTYVGIASPGHAVGGWGTCFPFTGSFYVKIDYQSTDCALLPLSATPMKNQIYFNPGTGLYSYNPVGAQSTIFFRDTLVTANGNEIDVKSTVSWNPSALSSQSVTLEDHFYDWNPASN